MIYQRKRPVGPLSPAQAARSPIPGQLSPIPGQLTSCVSPRSSRRSMHLGDRCTWAIDAPGRSLSIEHAAHADRAPGARSGDRAAWGSMPIEPGLGSGFLNRFARYGLRATRGPVPGMFRLGQSHVDSRSPETRSKGLRSKRQVIEGDRSSSIEGDRSGCDRPGEQIQSRVKRLQVNVTIKALFSSGLGSKRQGIEGDRRRSKAIEQKPRNPEISRRSERRQVGESESPGVILPGKIAESAQHELGVV